ncbi:MAG: HNH endonuclease [Bacteroidales bacterium]|nr:HNH endonuclease [Bacteroidales bacterium]
MRSIDRAFYKSREWENCRTAYLQQVGYWCERCKAKGIYEPARVVHHKIHLNESNYRDASISLNFDNLEALCQDCHNKEHFGRTDRRYEVDAEGHLIF